MDALAFTISNNYNGKCQFNQIYLLNLEEVLSFYEVEGKFFTSSRQNEKWEKIETKRNKTE